jgi:uncharacterized Zn finger protein
MARQTRPVAVVVGEEDMALGTAEFEAFAKSVGPRLVVLPSSVDSERLIAVLDRIVAPAEPVPPMPDDPLIARVLHADSLRDLAGGHTFERGRAYAQTGRVLDVRRDGSQLKARVKGSDTARYDVRLWGNDRGIAYACSCPAAAEGAVCKHVVAVALEWLDRTR